LRSFQNPCFWVKNGGVAIYYFRLTIDYWGESGKKRRKIEKKTTKSSKQQVKKKEKTKN